MTSNTVGTISRNSLHPKRISSSKKYWVSVVWRRIQLIVDGKKCT